MSNAQREKRYDILGIHIDALTIAQANRRICLRAANVEAGAAYVTKPYSEFFDGAMRHPELLPLMNDSWLCLPDGIAVCWAATYLYGGRHSFGRWLTTLGQIVLKPQTMYRVLPEKFAGANATWDLLRQARDAHLSVFLIGSPRHGTIQATARAIQHTVPQLKIAGVTPGEINGQQGPELLASLRHGYSPADLAQTITAANADIILVGMGFPLQEAVMSALTPLLDHGVMIGEGGTFDYESFGGHYPRAPQTIQKIGLEWLWRLIREPSRFRRQLAIPRFMWHVWRAGRQ